MKPPPLQAWHHSASAEVELLCACARSRLTEETAARVRELVRQPLDWQFLLQAGRRHGLMPLLHRHLLTPGLEAEAAAIQQLRNESRRIAIRNLLLSTELVKLLRSFQAHGIEAIPYKGPVLTTLAYGDLSLRPFDDLDLIVRERDVPRAKALLLSSGYLAGKHGTLSRFFAENSCHLAFVHANLGFPVELHWALAPRYFPLLLRQERLWQGLRRVPFGDIEVLAHAPEDLLLILCIHGGKHHWERLSWITDIAEIIRKAPQMRWDWLLAEAKRLRLHRMLQLGLWLAQKLLDTPFPDEVCREGADDPAVAALGMEVCRGLSRPTGVWDNLPFDLQMRDCFRDRAAHVLGLIFVPTEADWLLVRLPRQLYFLYYPLRALRLTTKYVGSLFSRRAPGPV